jgi:diguanylate cyclase (GGDEF)-like protein/PAS domain S-box-containing protein
MVDHTRLVVERDRLQAENQRLRAELAAAQQPEASGAFAAGLERARALVAALHEGIVFHDRSGAILECNPRAEAILGLTSDQLMGRTSIDPRWRAIHADGTPFPGEGHPAMVALHSGIPQRDVVMGVHKPDGTLTWILVNAQPLFHPGDSAPYAVVASFTDITAQRRLEQELREQRDFAVQVLETMGQGLTVVDASGHFTYVNPAYARMVGEPAEALLGRTPLDMTVAADHPTLLAARQARQEGETTSYETRLRAAGGEVRDVLITGVPYLVHGQPGGAISVITDISARKQLEADLARTTHRLDLFQRVASAANAAATLKEAVDQTMAALLEATDWRLGHVYLPDPDNPEQLRSSGWWYGPLLPQVATFVDITAALPIPRGAGLPGQVYASGTARWFTDMTVSAVLERAQAGRALGIKTACAFPILLRQQVVAVMEVFATRTLPRDPDLLAVMGHSGEQLGQVVERQQARQALEREQNLLDVILNSIEDGILACDAEGRITMINQAMANFHNLPDRRAPVALATLHANIRAADGVTSIPLPSMPLMRAVRGAVVRDEELVIAPAQRPARRLIVNGQPLRTAEGVQIGAVVALHDVTRQKELERHREALIGQLRRALARTDALYQVVRMVSGSEPLADQLQRVGELTADILQADRVAIITLDQERQVVTHFIGAGPGAALIEPVGFAELMRGLTGWVVRTGQLAHVTGSQADPREAPDIYARRLASHCQAVLVAPLTDQGMVLGTISVFQTANAPDFISDDHELLEAIAHQVARAIMRARLLEAVQQAALTDTLTGVYNRRGWELMAQPIWEQAVRQVIPLAVILLDVDHFKRVNDTAGHVVGDHVLHVIAARCQEAVRTMDIVGRYGGEEFVVLLPNTDQASAIEIAERVRRTIAATPIPTSAGPLALTVSLGVACWEPDLADLVAAVDRADVALYAAKRAGRNRVRLWQGDPPAER